MTELLHSTICGLLCSAAPHTPIGGGGGADGALQLLHLALLHLSQVEQNACTRNAYATPRRASASNHPPGQRVRMSRHPPTARASCSNSMALRPSSSSNARSYAQIRRALSAAPRYCQRMKTTASPLVGMPLGPHCRALRRGVIGDAIDGRSREGKFLRKCEAELVAQIGGEPSFAQRLLARRIARVMLKLELFDAKMARDSWTDHDARTYGGLSNSLRLMLRELGLKAASTAKPNPLVEHFSRPVRQSATP